MALQETVDQVVTGLGYELVDIERTGGGLLRVTIDWPWEGSERFINAEDCERVTRQLQFVLEVEGVGRFTIHILPLRTNKGGRTWLCTVSENKKID